MELSVSNYTKKEAEYLKQVMSEQPRFREMSSYTTDLLTNTIINRNLLPYFFPLFEGLLDQEYIMRLEGFRNFECSTDAHSKIGYACNPDRIRPNILTVFSHRNQYSRSSHENRNLTARLATELNAEQRRLLNEGVDITNIIQASPTYTALGLDKSDIRVTWIPEFQCLAFFFMYNDDSWMSDEAQDFIRMLPFLLFQTLTLDKEKYPEESKVISEGILEILESAFRYIGARSDALRDNWKTYKDRLGIVRDDNWIENLFSNMKNNLEQIRQNEYQNVLDMLEKATFEYQRAIRIERAAAYELARPIIEENGKGPFTEALRNSPWIQRVVYDEQYVYFHTVSPATFDAELAQNYIENPVNVRERKYFVRFIKGILKDEFKSYISNCIQIRLDIQKNNSNYNDGSVKATNYNGPVSPKKPVPNPHHDRGTGCLGTYRGEIYRARAAGNWGMVINLIENSAGSLNIVDNAIMDRLIVNYFYDKEQTKNIFVEKPDGTLVTFFDYLKETGELK